VQIGHLWEVAADSLRLQMEAVQNQVIRISEQIETRRNKRRPQ
jgi:hypothetical protein